MHDYYHPVASVYATTFDRQWSQSPAIHLGFYATTMLHEFVVHKGMKHVFTLLRKHGRMRRFSFVHIMQRMGFGAADVNFYATYLDDTFYRRIYCDARVGFLAECFSPRIRLYRGARWMDLWDTFLSNRNRGERSHWTRLTRACTVADAIILEHTGTEAQQLMPSTMLGALQRHYITCMTPYDSWPLMESIVFRRLHTARLRLLHRRWSLNSLRMSSSCAKETGPRCVATRPHRRQYRRCWNPFEHTSVRGLYVCGALRWTMCKCWFKPSSGCNQCRSCVLHVSMIPRTPQIAMTSLNRDTVDARSMAEWLW